MSRQKHKSASRVELGSRHVEVKPVRAWVQQGDSQNIASCVFKQNHHFSQDAVVSAEVEERRILHKRREKQEHLRAFQEEVKDRVKTLVKLKKQEQLQKSFRAVEVEKNVVRQSTTAAEGATSRKNRCVTRRTQDDLSIRNTTITRQSADSSKQRLDDHQHQVHKYNKHARRKLSTRRVIPQDYIHDDLPGGIWRDTSTRENPVASRLEPVPLGLEQCDGTLPCEDTHTDNVLQERIQSEDFVQNKPKVVHFEDNVPTEDTRKERIHRRSITQTMGSDTERPIHLPPNIYPGVQAEEDKKQLQTQRAMYRRLFMDIEREKVKENIKQKEQRIKIARLKRDKEDQRKKEEQELYEMVVPKDPVTQETAEDVYKREMREQRNLRNLLEKQTEEQRKQRENERYIEALRRSLKDKMSRQNISLPPLCCCGDTIWDTHPELCANNCIFYKNPKEYTKALQSLVHSCERM